MPAPARMVVAPLLKGDHVAPTRGARFSQSPVWIWISWRSPTLSDADLWRRMSSYAYQPAWTLP